MPAVVNGIKPVTNGSTMVGINHKKIESFMNEENSKEYDDTANNNSLNINNNNINASYNNVNYNSKQYDNVNEDQSILKHRKKAEYEKQNGHRHVETIEDYANNNYEGEKYGPSYSTKGLLPAQIGTDYDFKRKIVWFNLLGFLFLHTSAVYGFWLTFVSAKWLSIAWMFVVAFASGIGVTIGAHRMYSHKAFKANFVTRLALVILQTIAGQNCMYIWVRDHRQHHKYSDTDADPHNANRGFFFSHIGWLMSKKHPAVKSKGKTIDMSDLEADPIIMVQKMFYKPLYAVFAMALPIGIPVYFWEESYWESFFVCYMARYILMLNITWLVNSAAHLFGTKPYDKNMKPVESKLVAVLSVGEGWHNYHHAFPWDYRAAEFGLRLSVTTIIIDILASLGMVYDLKVASEAIVAKRAKYKGDGSHPIYGSAMEVNDYMAPYLYEHFDSKKVTPTIEDDDGNIITEERYYELHNQSVR